MRTAVESIRRMRGGSQSQLMRCDDDSYYVVKFQNNPQHRRVLANEMLATRLAARMGIFVPDVAVVEVSGELIKNTHDLVIQRADRRVPCSAGRQFGSKYPGHPSRIVTLNGIEDRDIPRIKRLDDFLGIFVFDKWTCNTDGRQAILFEQLEPDIELPSAGTLHAMMIDQGFCFNGGAWNFPDSVIRNFYVNNAVYANVRGLDQFDPWLSWLEDKLSLDILHEEAGMVPPEWYEEDHKSWNCLIERLYARRTRVRELIWSAGNVITSPFSNWKNNTRSIQLGKVKSGPSFAA